MQNTAGLWGTSQNPCSSARCSAEGATCQHFDPCVFCSGGEERAGAGRQAGSSAPVVRTLGREDQTRPEEKRGVEPLSCPPAPPPSLPPHHLLVAPARSTWWPRAGSSLRARLRPAALTATAVRSRLPPTSSSSTTAGAPRGARCRATAEAASAARIPTDFRARGISPG